MTDLRSSITSLPSPVEEMGELTAMGEAELIQRYNAVARVLAEGRPATDKLPYLVHAQIYIDELARRRAEEQAERMTDMTTTITRLTWVIALATILMMIVTIITLFKH